MYLPLYGQFDLNWNHGITGSNPFKLHRIRFIIDKQNGNRNIVHNRQPSFLIWSLISKDRDFQNSLCFDWLVFTFAIAWAVRNSLFGCELYYVCGARSLSFLFSISLTSDWQLIYKCLLVSGRPVGVEIPHTELKRRERWQWFTRLTQTERNSARENRKGTMLIYSAWCDTLGSKWKSFYIRIHVYMNWPR